MATVDELLNATTESQVCTIDPDTRVITVPSCYKEFGVEADEKVNRINFQCPKVVGDNIDLTAFNLYINYMNASGQYNAYLVDDVTVSGDNITFSWLLSRHVTEKSGTVNYIVCAKKSDDTGVVNEWNTKVATGTVGVGLEATTEVEEQNADVIEQILVRITDVESTKPDWNQGTPTAKDYIKNRPFYATFTAPNKDIYKEVDLLNQEPYSVHMIIDGTYRYSILKYFPIDLVKEFALSSSSALLGVQLEIVNKSGVSLPLQNIIIGTGLLDRRNIKMLDSTNYYGEFNWGVLYFILDSTILNEENKTIFPQAGVYVKRLSATSLDNYSVFKVKGGMFSRIRFEEIYLPAGTQGKEISDSNNYFTTKTVEGALDQIGSQLNSYVKKTEIPVDGTTIKLNDEGQLTLALSNASEVSF